MAKRAKFPGWFDVGDVVDAGMRAMAESRQRLLSRPALLFQEPAANPPETPPRAMAREMERMMDWKLSTAQAEALRRMKLAPLQRGRFDSGWGPCGSPSAPRVHVREATANVLISRGFAERWDVEGDATASTLRITNAGLAALASYGG